MIRLMAARLTSEEIEHEREDPPGAAPGAAGVGSGNRGASAPAVRPDPADWRSTDPGALAARLRKGRSSVMHGAADSRLTRCG